MSTAWSPASSAPAIGALAGDVTGTLGANTVVKLRGRAVASTAPSDGQALVWSSARSDWEPGTVSGGGGVQVVTVPVSSAQILDLFNTPVVLIPGVAGKVTVVTGIVIAYLAGLVPYLDGGGGINVQTPVGGLSWITPVPGAGFWDQATDQFVPQGYGAVAAQPYPSATYSAADVVIFEDTANPTLGDGTLLVTLSYFLAPTA